MIAIDISVYGKGKVSILERQPVRDNRVVTKINIRSITVFLRT
jgi:hypothetical protein